MKYGFIWNYAMCFNGFYLHYEMLRKRDVTLQEKSGLVKGMEIWLDTSNVDFVSYAEGLGVTTNPTILSLSKVNPQELISELLKAQKGLVVIQVLAEDTQGFYKQAKMLVALSDRILIKIPVTQNGIRAIYALNQEGISTLATAIFELKQAFLAFKAGANYLAPYLGT